jgi:hypothetical protein
LPPLKPMGQSWRGVIHILEEKKHDTHNLNFC